MDLCKGDAQAMNKLVSSVSHFLRNNSQLILTTGAIAGTAATAYFSARAGFRSREVIEQKEDQLRQEDGRMVVPEGPSDPFSRVNTVKMVWKLYIPAGVAGVVTVACVVGANRISSRKLLAATMAYSLTEQAFTQYKEKVVEQLGENKERAIRDEIVKTNVLKNPPQMELALTPGHGVMCCEQNTMRYFVCNMETLRRSMNDINAKLLVHDTASLDDFYYMIGLKPTQYSADLGWQSPKLMDLQFTTVLSEDGIPCIAFAYNYIRPLD